MTTIHPPLAVELTCLGALTDTPSVIYDWTDVLDWTGSRRDKRRRLVRTEDDTIALRSENMGSKQNLEVVIDATGLASEAARHAGDGRAEQEESFLKAARPVVAATNYDSATTVFCPRDGYRRAYPCRAGDAQPRLDVVAALGKERIRPDTP